MTEKPESRPTSPATSPAATAFLKRIEEYFAGGKPREYNATQRAELMAHLGSASPSYLSALWHVMTETIAIGDLYGALPDVATLRRLTADTNDRHALMLADRERVNRKALPEPEGIDYTREASARGIDTTEAGWLVALLFSMTAEARKAGGTHVSA